MKTTSTKKLSIILLSLGCVIAAGFGTVFSGIFSNEPKAYAQTRQRIALDNEDVILEEFSHISGISEKDLKFYALSSNGTVESLYQYYLTDRKTAEQEILAFLSDYSQGNLINNTDISAEDWFVPPDEVGAYDFKGCLTGIADTWTDYYTSKSFITTEEFYWRESGFQWGHMQLNRNIGVHGGGNYYSVATATCVYWDSFWLVDMVWLDEGEVYEFGIKSNKQHSSKYMGAMETDFFVDNYLTDKAYKVRDNSYSASSSLAYQQGTYWGLFTDYDASTPADDNDPAVFGCDPVPKTKADYKDEFGSSIPNNNGSNGSQNNSSYLKWAPDSLGASNYNAGVHKLQVSADAPSGVYYMGFYRPYSNGYWSVYSAGTSSSTTKPSTVSTSFHSLTGWPYWSYYYNYAVKKRYGTRRTGTGVCTKLELALPQRNRVR